MGRGFGGCGSDAEFDAMALRERRSLDGTSRRTWHGWKWRSVGRTDAGERAENLAAWFHSLDLAGSATGSSATSGLWTSEAVLYCSYKPDDEREMLIASCSQVNTTYRFFAVARAAEQQQSVKRHSLILALNFRRLLHVAHHDWQKWPRWSVHHNIFRNMERSRFCK